jgi:hypothetical protein
MRIENRELRIDELDLGNAVGCETGPFPSVFKEYPNCPASRPKAKRNCASFMPTEDKGVTGAVS